jgi:hypothetical protein
MDFMLFSSCVLLESRVFFLDGFIRLLWKSSIFPDFGGSYSSFCEGSTFSVDYIKPYPSDLFSNGYNGGFTLDNSIYGYSKDYFLFLEKNITSLEDFIFFLFETCSNPKNFASIYHYYFDTFDQNFWPCDFFGFNYTNNRVDLRYTSLELPCKDLSSIFSVMSLKDGKVFFLLDFHALPDRSS